MDLHPFQEEIVAQEIEDRPFFNVFDGVDGRTDSSYLDMQERREAEILRARAEGREPNLEEGALPGSVGTPMVPEERRVDNKYYSNPSIVFTGTKDVDPVAVLGVDVGTADDDVDLSLAAQYARERRNEEDTILAAEGSSETASTSSVSAEVPPVDLVSEEPDPFASTNDENTAS